MERIAQSEVPEGLYQVLLSTEEYITHSGLDKNLLELMRYRISQINHCAYCMDMHYKLAVHYGEDPQRLYSVSAWRETPYYNEKEEALLAFAEALTRLPDGGVENAIYDSLAQHFNKGEIALLTLAVVQINSWNRLANVFRTTPGQFKVN